MPELRTHGWFLQWCIFFVYPWYSEETSPPNKKVSMLFLSCIFKSNIHSHRVSQIHDLTHHSKWTAFLRPSWLVYQELVYGMLLTACSFSVDCKRQNLFASSIIFSVVAKAVPVATSVVINLLFFILILLLFFHWLLLLDNADPALWAIRVVLAA